MEPCYDDSFSKRYQSIPAAYYLHRYGGTDYPWRDRDGNCTYTNLHNHAEMELLLFECGTGVNRVGQNGAEIPFDAGDLFLINPFELHSGYYDRATPEQMHLVMDFPVTLLEHPNAREASRLSAQLLSQAGRFDNRIRPDDPAYGDLCAAYRGMYAALAGEQADELRFFAELYRFFGLLMQTGRFHTATAVPAPQGDMDFIKAAVGYIGEHFSEPISTRDIASELRYSKEHFCRLFKTNFTVSFIEYLTQFRIEKAKRYLIGHTSLEVAEKCGFSGQSNFSRAFRSLVGISPSEYKKLLRTPADGKKPE